MKDVKNDRVMPAVESLGVWSTKDDHGVERLTLRFGQFPDAFAVSLDQQMVKELMRRIHQWQSLSGDPERCVKFGTSALTIEKH